MNQILTTLYDSTPDGICGNEDTGQMSAWYIFSSLGFYPMNPVSGKYQMGAPLFDKAKFNYLQEGFFNKSKQLVGIQYLCEKSYSERSEIRPYLYPI